MEEARRHRDFRHLSDTKYSVVEVLLFTFVLRLLFRFLYASQPRLRIVSVCFDKVTYSGRATSWLLLTCEQPFDDSRRAVFRGTTTVSLVCLTSNVFFF